MSLPAKPFAVALKNARKSKNLTQAELAEALEISLPYIKDLERSRSNPSYEMFERIIRYFNLSADDVIYPVKEPESHTLKKINRLLRRCSEQQLRVILATAEAVLGMKPEN